MVRYSGIFVIAVLLMGSCSNTDAQDERAESLLEALSTPTTRVLARTVTPPRSCVNVVYKVEGTATGADITMANSTGDTEQAQDRAVPLGGVGGLSIGCVPHGQFLYISAQNTGDSGTIKCIIEADGSVVAQAASNGAYVIAGCDAVAP